MEEEEELSIHFSGYVLSEILNEASYCGKTHDGLLYGECNLDFVETISDLQQDGCRETAKVSVHDCSSCKKAFGFYTHVGTVLAEGLETMQNGREQDCIGFYRIRRNSNLSISIREKTVMQNLLKSSSFHHPKILFFLVVPMQEENKATFNVLYKSFVCELNTAPVVVKTEIVSLENTENSYKHKSLLLGKKSSPSTTSMNLLEEYAKGKFFTETGSVGIADTSYSMFYKTLVLLNNIQQELITCDETIEEYNDEIETLEQCKQMEEGGSSSTSLN